MLLYENAPSSTYEEMKTWYPVWYREVLEMDVLWRVFGGQIDAIQAGIIQMIDNNFIDYADETTVARLENFLMIKQSNALPLSNRKSMLKSHFIGFGKISSTMIRNIIQSYVSSDVLIEFKPQKDSGVSILTIDIYPKEPTKDLRKQDIEYLIEEKLPAHILKEVAIHFPISGQANIYTGVYGTRKCKKITTEVKNYGLE